MATFGERLKYLRTRQGVSQALMADILSAISPNKVSRSTIGMWESGRNMPSRESLEALAGSGGRSDVLGAAIVPGDNGARPGQSIHDGAAARPAAALGPDHFPGGVLKCRTRRRAEKGHGKRGSERGIVTKYF